MFYVMQYCTQGKPVYEDESPAAPLVGYDEIETCHAIVDVDSDEYADWGASLMADGAQNLEEIAGPFKTYDEAHAALQRETAPRVYRGDVEDYA